MSNISLPVKHQQQGVSLLAFSEQTGIRLKQLLHYCRKGQIIGARKHPLTKKWWIYPPAKLVLSGLGRPRSSAPQARAEVLKAPDEVLSPRAAPPSGAGVMAEVFIGHADTHPAPHVPEAAMPSCRPLLISEFEEEELGELPAVFAAAEVREACRAVRRAAGEAHYPLVLSASQMKLVEWAVSLAIDEAIDAMKDEPGGRHEIKPSLDAYNQIYRALKAAKAANKAAATGDIGSMEL